MEVKQENESRCPMTLRERIEKLEPPYDPIVKSVSRQAYNRARADILALLDAGSGEDAIANIAAMCEDVELDNWPAEAAIPEIYKVAVERKAEASLASPPAAVEEEVTGISLIVKERQRQIDQEGWTPEHDDGHASDEMALAAACYATPILLYQRHDYANQVHYVDPWPWEDRWDKRPSDGNVVLPNDKLPTPERIRQLAKAGALIAAEIDRLNRLPTTPAKG